MTGANQLLTVTGPLANSVIQYAYDELGRVLGTSINGSANTSSMAYDALGRVTSATNPLGQFGYGYVDQTARLLNVTYPNKQVTNYGYYPNVPATGNSLGNDDQRLAQIQNLQSTAGSNLSTFNYTYDPEGIIQTWAKQLGSGSQLTSNFGYDAADQLISASVPSASSVVQNYSYQYDLAGNRTTEQIDPTVTGSSYNNLNQLVSQATGGSMAFTGTVSAISTAANPATLTLASQTLASPAQPATIDSSGNWRGTAPVTAAPAAQPNKISLVATDATGKTTTKTISITVSGGTARTLLYDANGNLTNDGNGKTYAFDAADRMTSVTQTVNGVQTVTGFVYDGFSRRVQETQNGTLIKQWVWCGGLQPCEERDASNNVTKRFYGHGEQINGTNYYFTFDHLGSVREMTDSAGNLVARYDFDPYGRRTLVSGTDLADFGFTGFYHDKVTNLDYSRTRPYTADLARWIGQDPLGEDGGINLYQYCDNNPVNEVDPTGEVAGVDDAAEFTTAELIFAGAAAFGAYEAYQHQRESELALQDFLNRMEARKEATDAPKSCPNPNGKKGGAKHQEVVKEVEQGVKDRGLTPVKELPVETPGGEKGKRFVDVAGQNAEGETVETHQVGKQTQGGNPVAREGRALDDIEKATGQRPTFHPYN